MGWSGEHDGCPLHGHATDGLKAIEGCTCKRHLSAKELEAKLTRVMENLAESHASEVGLEEQIAKAAKVFNAQAMPHPMHEWKRHFLRVYLSGEGT